MQRPRLFPNIKFPDTMRDLKERLFQPAVGLALNSVSFKN